MAPPPPEVIEVVDDEEVVEDDVATFDADDDADLEIEEESNPDPFFVVEQMPVFPCIKVGKKEYCGEVGLMRYIQSSIKYPPIAKEYNITGKVYVKFIVDKNGNVTQVELARGVDKSLDTEALRVIRSLPKYKPGMQRGQPAKVIYTIPINFQLN